MNDKIVSRIKIIKTYGLKFVLDIIALFPVQGFPNVINVNNEYNIPRDALLITLCNPSPQSEQTRKPYMNPVIGKQPNKPINTDLLRMI